MDKALHNPLLSILISHQIAYVLLVAHIDGYKQRKNVCMKCDVV
jgi:hypothetical protein